MSEPATLSQLLDTALDLPPDEREQWLEALPRAHDDLKPRLRALLARAAQIETSDFLQTLPKVDAGPDSAAGDDIGPYRLVREIGVGGMGSVWLAERHDGALKRPVALKFLRAHGPREALGERLARERDILAALVHPGIARLYDAGLTIQGLPYLALEYIEGEHIDKYCRARDLDVRARLAVFLQVARAVAYAHAKLVVHRDLKPANVLVSADGLAHLLDFGIAKLLEDGQALETRLTHIAGRALTPEYASPEQIRGEPITVASDVYSLGVLLYELLTDAAPYRLKRSSRGALEDAIVDADPERPSERARSATVRRALRGDLDAIVLKALKKKPEARYLTVNALADDIERHLHGRPVEAQPDTAWYRLGKFVARNKLGVGAAAAVLVAVLAGAGVAVWQARVAIAEQRRAEQVKDFIASIFADASPWSGPQEKPSAVELLTRAQTRIDGMSHLDAATRIELLTVIGESLEGLGAATEAGAIAERSVAQGTAQLGADHPLTLRARSLRAQVHRDQGKTAAMRVDVEALLAVLTPLADSRPQAAVQALNDVAELEADEAHYAQAEQAAQRALALAQRHSGSWEPRALARQRATLWKVIAASHEGRLDHRAAIDSARRAFEYALEGYRGQPKHPVVINNRLILARVSAAVDLPGAIQAMQQSIADIAEVLGPEHPFVGTYTQSLAVWQARNGELAAAAASIARALPIVERQIGADSGHFGAALDTAAYIALLSRQARRAVELGDRAHAVAIRHLPEGSEHPTVIRMRRALARAYLGETSRAVAELESIVETFRVATFAAPSRAYLALGEAQRLSGDFRSALDSQRSGIALVVEGPNAGRERMAFLTEIGLNHLELGDAPEAIEALESAIALIAKHQAGVTPQRADALVGLGRARMMLGKHADAAAAFEAANAFWQAFDPASPAAKASASWLERARGGMSGSRG